MKKSLLEPHITEGHLTGVLLQGYFGSVLRVFFAGTANQAESNISA
jgi:hypothetical protein